MDLKQREGKLSHENAQLKMDLRDKQSRLAIYEEEDAKVGVQLYYYRGAPKCGHPEIRTSCFNQDTLFCPNAIELCVISPLKSGHLSNWDTLSGSQKCPH